MEMVLNQDWRAAFALAAAAETAKRHDERMKVFYEDIDQEQKKNQERNECEEELKNLEEFAATPAQVAEFNTHLDAYDGKTVESLMENREALDKIHDAVRRMTENAYALPDGRRVFKTADGRQVFDEHGLQMSLKTVDPDAIGDNHPRWETFKAAKDAEGKLVTEQNALIQFHAKIDEARTRAGNGDMSKKQLDDLDADLKSSMPASVRQKLGLAPEASGDMKMRPEEKAFADRSPMIDEPSRRLQSAPVPY